MRKVLEGFAVLRPEDVTVIVDSREQRPFSLAPMRVMRSALPEGDYSVAGLVDVVRVERKSTQDLVQCVGRERPRFERELVRLRGFRHAAVVVEGSIAEILQGRWPGVVSPRAVLGSIVAWSLEYVPVIPAGSREDAEAWTRAFLWTTAKHEWQRLRAMAEAAAAVPAGGARVPEAALRVQL